ncbi:Hypothetical protein LUCI_2399 [Lucifera butyrica]|uniref:HTH cro/C1-type domain-containing protein n=1 Tax=Lucifera butyrica TaxID=1351585 RepID=A0A498R849_9FIRM|nr:helix-turn-helix transcriptional regulator [Lucifera butyrica]VBB07155.1 Hypothetical protein LUCI_2399 [Lucifera butyrica]
MDYGKRLRELRNSKYLSANALGRMVDLDQTMIYKIERNEAKPSLDSLERICSALDVTMAEFFADNPTEAANVTIRSVTSDDAELLEFRKELEEREDLQRFFRQLKSLSPQTLKRVIRYIKMVEEEEAKDNL